MKNILIVYLMAFSCPLFAQLPDTDIFLADIINDKGKISFSKPVNITNRKGYDNQPSFTPDGKSLLYVAIVDSVQSDVFQYDMKSKINFRMTRTPESEYSPSYSPDARNISVVRVDSDKGQRFYNFPLKDIAHPKLIKNSDSIGYFCWLNDSLLAMFILGNAFTLEVLNVHTAERKLIASDIGRCMKLSPDNKNLFFVIKQNDKEWGIFRMDIHSFQLTRIVTTLKDNEDFAVMPDGTLLMGSDGKLFSYNPEVDKDWQKIADFSKTFKSFYRISVNQRGDKIAIVAYAGKKP